MVGSNWRCFGRKFMRGIIMKFNKCIRWFILGSICIGIGCFYVVNLLRVLFGLDLVVMLCCVRFLVI